MRISLRGVKRAEEAFSFSFEGREIQAYAGESLAAALVSAGILSCRETSRGEPRGVFCGMGVCGECAVLVDERPARACMEMASAGAIVTRQPARRLPPAVAGSNEPEPETPVREVEVLVLGAGPGGLAAAHTAARHGAGVLLIDERKKPGGQYFKQPGQGFTVAEAELDPQFRAGLALFEDAREAGVEFIFNATLWGSFSDGELGVNAGGKSLLLRARRIVVSPGAYEKPQPFPGWTLPGVMTTGAAQTLLRAYQTSPGQRVLIAGNGPLNLQLASELLAAGVTVVAVAELSARPGLSRLMDLLSMVISSPDLVRDGLRHLFALFRARVPLHYRHRILLAEGNDQVRRAQVVKVDRRGVLIAGSEKAFDVDAVCLGYGFLPQSELARALGVSLDSAGRESGSPLASSDSDGRSASNPSVFVIGDARGLGGARVAEAQGHLAGAAAATDLGYQSAPGPDSAARASRRLRLHRRFQRALWSVYAATPPGVAAADADTLICRCESVSKGQLEALLSDGVGSLGALKRETRAGMGACQGRYCRGLMLEMLDASDINAAADVAAGANPGSPDDAFFAPRPPFKPVSLDVIATRYDPEPVFNRSAGAESP